MVLKDNILSVDRENIRDIALEIAGLVKARRLELNLTQEGLSVRSGVGLPTYRRFERTGMISLKGLLQIAFALQSLEDFRSLFKRRQYETLDEVLNEYKKRRKRGRKNG